MPKMMFSTLKVCLSSLALLAVTSFASDACAHQSLSSAQTQLTHLEATSGGRLGVSAIDTGNNQQIQYRAQEYFPIGCTSKVIGVAAILKKSTGNKLFLQERIHFEKNDLTNWSPITEKHLSDGMTIAELSAAAISYSDNTAMNLLAKKLGGIQDINAFALGIGDPYFKLNHGWPEEALSSPASKMDASTPAAMEKSLRNIILGNILEIRQREMLINWMKNNVTGNTRIRAGVPRGWVVGDKTGTGFHYGTTNDIAVIWPPKCAPIVVAIFYSSNKKNAPQREDVIASATRILINSYLHTNNCLKKTVMPEFSHDYEQSKK